MNTLIDSKESMKVFKIAEYVSKLNSRDRALYDLGFRLGVKHGAMCERSRIKKLFNDRL